MFVQQPMNKLNMAAIENKEAQVFLVVTAGTFFARSTGTRGIVQPKNLKGSQ